MDCGIIIGSMVLIGVLDHETPGLGAEQSERPVNENVANGRVNLQEVGTPRFTREVCDAVAQQFRDMRHSEP